MVSTYSTQLASPSSVLVLSSAGVWISPGQWGPSIWFAALVGLFRHHGVARGAPHRHCDLFFPEPRSTSLRPRRLARRSVGDSAASITERFTSDLHLLHDLRSAHHPGFPARTLSARLRGSCGRSLSGVLRSATAGALFRADRLVTRHPSY